MKMKMEVGKSIIPAGQSGQWKVEKFEVDEYTARMSCIRCLGRYVRAGRYTRLMCGDNVVMSDTRAEVMDLLTFRTKANGEILVNGLGLGLAVQEALEKPTVIHLTVIEKSPDVIRLVFPHLRKKFGSRVDVIEADAFTWPMPKGVRWNVVWHDIWDTVCADHLPDMHRLHRRFGRRCDWQGSWCRYECEHPRWR